MLSEGSDFKSYVLSEKHIKNLLKICFTSHNYYLQQLYQQCNNCMNVTEPCITLRLCFQKELSKPLESSHENLQILEWSLQRVKY